MKKKILALLLAMAVAVTSTATFAVAETGDTTPPTMPDTVDGVKLNKTLTKNTDGTYTINLESYTTGTVKTETSGSTAPTDIVLVLDQSGSMAFDFSGKTASYENSRQKALKDSVISFINNVADDAKGADGIVGTGDDVAHRISIVTFVGFGRILKATGTIANDWWKWDIEPFYNSTGENPDNTQDTYRSALYSVDAFGPVSPIKISSPNQSYAGLTNRIYNLPNPYGSTDSSVGMRAAYEILNATESDQKEQLVIMFTDGVPTTDSGSGSSGSEFSTDVANGAITASKSIKGLGATVYTVGILDDANPNSTADNVNKYMNYVSSNFEEATTLSNGGSRTDSKYYLTADDADELENVFQTISSTIATPTISLDETTVLVDVVSEYFELPEGFNKNSVTAQIVKCTGYEGEEPTWEATGTAVDKSNITIDGKKVSVTGFNYDENFVTKTAKDSNNDYGSKLVLSFDVEPLEDFIGGNDVPSNTVESGLYDKDGNGIVKFPQPNADIEIDFIFDKADQTIYLGNSMSYKNFLKISGSEIDGINNDFVNITYEIFEDKNDNGSIDDGDTSINTVTIKAGETASEVTDANLQIKPTHCTDYIVRYTVTPIEVDGDVDPDTIQPKTQIETFTIHVLQPDIDENDLYVDYGITDVDLLEDCTGGIFWEQTENHPDGTAIPEVNTATKPTVELTFTDEDNHDYTVSSFKGISVTEDKTFKMTKIKITSSDGKNIVTELDVPDYEQESFNIYVNRYDLAVTKTISKADWENYKQDIVLNVAQDNDTTVPVVMHADDFEVVDGNYTCTKKVTGLYAGAITTTVSEDTDWAWRYSATVNGDASYQYGTDGLYKSTNEPDNYQYTKDVTVTNELANNNWISISQAIKNIFKGGSN